MRRTLLTAVCCATLMVASSVVPGDAGAARPARSQRVARPSVEALAHPPVLAYYYIWFDTSSWRRAKTDYPLAGRYSSDDPAVMREQVRLAQEAGIDGFIVSWKHTATLDRRLEQLIGIAEKANFKLAVIYQGLDFHRHPLPTDTVARDLGYFAVRFAPQAPFKIFAKPLLIWSGTWKFSAADIARATAPIRGTVAVLGSEKNVAGYERIAPWVDGDAYYWSSVNPTTYRGYIEKLTDLGNAVHERQGLWIAPAAVGFDARKVGGTTVVPRRDGETLRTEIDAALASPADALGLISWNEYSESSHIEPSVRYGYRALDVVGERFGTGRVRPSSALGPSSQTPPSGHAASSASPARPLGLPGPMVLVVFGGLITLLAVLGVRRARGGHGPSLRVVRDPGPAPDSRAASAGVAARTRQEIMAARRGARRRRAAGAAKTHEGP